MKNKKNTAGDKPGELLGELKKEFKDKILW